MKIIYISDATLPSRAANSVQVMKMCQAFSKAGNMVDLIARRGRETEFFDGTTYEYYGVEPCFGIKKIRCHSTGIGAFVYGITAGLKAVGMRPDLIYGRSILGCFMGALFRCPVIYESHTPIGESRRIKQWMFSRLIRMRCLRKVVVISESLKNYYLTSYSINEDKILVAHDGADCPDNIYSSIRMLERNDNIEVGYTGHLYDGRGIEIIAEMADRCKWARFEIVGGQERDIAYWRNRFCTIDNLKFVGYLPPALVDLQRNKYDVLIAPYQKSVKVVSGNCDTARWMSPLKIFEYMASGKAIIASNMPVLREVLEHERNALLCDPEQPGEWISALTKLKEDPSLRVRLGLAAKNKLLADYTWETRVKRVLL